LLPRRSGHRSDHLTAAPQLDQGNGGPRPFKSHEACPIRHRRGQQPAGHPRIPARAEAPTTTADIPAEAPSQGPGHQDMPSLHDDKANEQAGSRGTRPQDRSF
jgi:hypothetical protein